MSDDVVERVRRLETVLEECGDEHSRGLVTRALASSELEREAFLTSNDRGVVWASLPTTSWRWG